MAVLVWLRAHPEIWPFVLAFVSLGFRLLAQSPRGRAAVEVLESVGLDPIKLVNALRKLVTGAGPPASGIPGDPGQDAPPTSPSDRPTLQHGTLSRVGLVVLVLSAASLGCSPAANRRAARTVLDSTEVACVLLTHLVDEDEVMQACAIADELRPHLRALLAGKAAARRESAGGSE